jgi:anti-sigma-K factor RskA
MSVPEDNGLEPPSDELLAGEYVLGALDAEQRRAVQVRMASDAAFARQIAEWERRLGSLAADTTPVDVAPHVWERVRSRLGWTAAPDRTGLWQSVRLWRAATAVAAAAAIVAALVGRIPQNAPQQPPAQLQATGQPVTTLARDSGAPGWLASIDAAHGRLVLVPVPAPRDSLGRVPELWLIPMGKAPVPLGLLSSDRTDEITVPLALRSALTSGSVLAVSLEPPGGAPHGAPTGPIIVKGAIQL